MAAPKGPSRPRKFGEVVLAKGYCTEHDLARALRIQQEQDKRGERHRLLGILMIEEGILSTTQLIEILKELQPEPAGRG